MKEIGGYLEIEHYHMPMLHDGMCSFNCARNCLAYLIEKKQIKTIYIPKYLCDSILEVCLRYAVDIRFYSIGSDFLPINLQTKPGSWVYIVNYYGQLSNNTLMEQKKKYRSVVIDNAQSYFQEPIPGVDTIYSCRKFFGVTDGAFLSSNVEMDEMLPTDESFERMRFVLGRFERNAEEFYSEYREKEDEFNSAPIRKMSVLTDNLLHSIDYNAVKKRRTENFSYLHKKFSDINKLSLKVPQGAYMYPLYIDRGAYIRKKLMEAKIFVPTLWPDVMKHCGKNSLEYKMAKNILPLPVDQRYTISDMESIAKYIETMLV